MVLHDVGATHCVVCGGREKVSVCIAPPPARVYSTVIVGVVYDDGATAVIFQAKQMRKSSRGPLGGSVSPVLLCRQRNPCPVFLGRVVFGMSFRLLSGPGKLARKPQAKGSAEFFCCGLEPGWERVEAQV